MIAPTRRSSGHGGIPALTGVLVCLLAPALRGGAPGPDEAILATATVESGASPKIILSFPGGTPSDAKRSIVGHKIHRKPKDAQNTEDWKLIAPDLPGDAVSYTHSGPDVKAGSAHEYRITRTVRYPVTATSTGTMDLHSYVYAGLDLPPERSGYDTNHSRGKIMLIVDTTQASALSKELSQLEEDLAGDGWTVLRHDFARGVAPNSSSGALTRNYPVQVTALKTVIQRAYTADPDGLRAVLLFGHLPVPYSGSLTPDGHANQRAWPTDTYYGAVTNATDKLPFAWTDTRLNFENRSPFTPRNSNRPNDGKFDNGSCPFQVQLMVGRVDLSDMPAFRSSETELLRQYLNKNHRYRQAGKSYRAAALIRNQFTCHTRPWATFTSFFGKDNIVDAGPGQWFDLLGKDTFLWAYGAGTGDCLYECATGIGHTRDFAARDAQVVFTCLFGSYFGDWDAPNSLLRAPLGNGDTLTSSWHADERCFDSISADWVPPLFHHMALGETIGYSVRLTQNFQTAYRKAANMVPSRPLHISLMGDPTLRLHMAPPVPSLTATREGSKSVNLKWTPSPAPDLTGYFIYRGSDRRGPFTLLNRTNPLPPDARTYTDSDASAGAAVYMVRAVKLERSSSGTYQNLSQGAFASVR